MNVSICMRFFSQQITWFELITTAFNIAHEITVMIFSDVSVYEHQIFDHNINFFFFFF